MIVIQQLVNGFVLGSGYVLVALALTILLGVLKIGDFSQGSLYTFGCFITLFLVKEISSNIVLVIIVTAVTVALVGSLSYLVCYRPVEKRPQMYSFIVGIGLMIVFDQIILLIWGGHSRMIPLSYATNTINAFGIFITPQRLLVIVCTITIIIALNWIISKSKFGKAMRAVAQDREAAAVVGIDIRLISLFSFALASALSGVASGLVGPIYTLSAFMGMYFVLKGFIVCVIGGMGNIKGAIIGGYVLGEAESLGAAFLSPVYADAIGFVAVISILLYKPSGLFGEVIN